MSPRAKWALSRWMYYPSEIASFVFGTALLFGLAVVALGLAALVVVGFAVSAIREEAAYMWSRIRSGPPGAS